MRHLIDLESLREVLLPSRAVVHEISDFKARLVLSLLLVKGNLEKSESKLLIDVKIVHGSLH